MHTLYCLMISFLLLLIHSGCGDENKVASEQQSSKNDTEKTDASPNKKKNIVVAFDEEPVSLPPPATPPIPDEPPPFMDWPLVPPDLGYDGGDGFFIGDDGDDDDGPSNRCGNSEQEASSNRQCPHELYGTALSEGGTPTLVSINPNTGEASLVADITGNISGRVVIDFSPTGELYGVALPDIIGGNAVLVRIDCRTGAAITIGSTGVVLPHSITDINFDGVGRLWAYVKTIDNTDTLGTINIATGAYTAIGTTNIFGGGNGIGSSPLQNDILYDVTDIILFRLSKTTGVATFVAGLDYPPQFDSDVLITAMDADFSTDIMYAVADDTSGRYVTTLDVIEAEVAFLTDSPIAVPTLESVAFSQTYEECDNSTVIPGAGCDEQCLLYEINCADGIDNDFNGLIDCSDPNCQGQSCNDQNGCTDDDFCDSFQCTGSPLVCNDGNQCTSDACLSTGDQSSTCIYSFASGGCSVDDNSCTVGICQDDETPFCLELDKEEVPIEQGGCEDGNPCTAELCDSSTALGLCDYVALNGPSGEECVPLDSFGEPFVGVCAQGYSVCSEGDPVLSPEIGCQPVAYPGDFIENCTDLLDNDCDGLVDAFDPECALIVFATSIVDFSRFDGDFGGTAGADAVCNEAALAADFDGVFVSFTSDINSNAAARIGNILQPWYLVDGTLVANNSLDLLDGTIQNAIHLDEYGNSLESGPTTFVWTGSDAAGMFLANDTCLNWTSFSNGNTGRTGVVSATNSQWASNTDTTCNEPQRLYCFQLPQALPN